MLVYQATRIVSVNPYKAEERDFSEAEGLVVAQVWVEEAKFGGRVVTFVKERNLPFCQPEFVHRSCALTVRDSAPGSLWRDVNIF